MLNFVAPRLLEDNVGMRFFLDSIAIARSAIWARKARSALSILGIVIAVLNIAGLMTVAFSVKHEIVKGIEGLGSNLVIVLPGKLSEGGTPNFSAQVGASTLTEEDVQAIRSEVPEAKNVSYGMLLAGAVKRGSESVPSAFVFAGTPDMKKAFNLKIGDGRFLSEQDENARARVAVLGFTVAEALFPGESAMGKRIEIRGEEFTVIGVIQKAPIALNFGPDMNSLVMMPINTGWEISKTKQIFRIMMQASDAEQVNPVRNAVKEAILRQHRGEEDFSVLSQDDLVGLVGGILNVLATMLAAIATISLIVGGIGIMNIMLVSVSERTREIGVRKAVGATRGAILLQFLIESVILTTLGGVIAIVLFMILVLVAGSQTTLPLEINPLVISGALAFAVLSGVLFGMLPAYRASRKDPIEALRYE